MMSLEQVNAAVGGVMTGASVDMANVSINTRADCTGRLFVALKGENFDAHDYVQNASAAGAVALMVEREVDVDLPCVVVDNTHSALKILASWWRSQFSIPLIGVTGSVGKTTVKEMLGSIFIKLGAGVVTHGNLNNEIGVPLTLMRLTSADQYAIVEMGMNQAGEIGRLSAVAKPTVALVNNAAAAHLEGLGTVEAVAHAKGEIFSGLAADGVAVINADDEHADVWRNLIGQRRTLEFSLHSDADITATYVEKSGEINIAASVCGEAINVTLKALGKHSVSNALAAIACAHAAGVHKTTIIDGLESYRPVSGRLNPLEIANTILFDDTYNANPASMMAAVEVLAGYDDGILIVGDMAELGHVVEQAHIEIGQYAKAQGVSSLLACGKYADDVVTGFGVGGRAFASQDDLLSFLSNQPMEADAILVKGSRSAKMERVVQAIEEMLSLEDSELGKKNKMGNAENGAGVS